MNRLKKGLAALARSCRSPDLLRGMVGCQHLNFVSNSAAGVVSASRVYQAEI